MDSDTLMEVATAIKRVKMFPYFDIAHYILQCIAVKEDTLLPQFSGQQVFSRIHPLSCWVGSMMLCFAGGILGNSLLGDPLLEPLKNEISILIATTVWFLINYAPFDSVYRLCKFTPIKLIILFLKEIQRAHKVHHGILFALKNFSGSYFLVCLFGTLKGSGAQHMRIFQRLVCGVWLPSSLELLKPSYVTKASLVASILFLLKYKGFIDVSEEMIYFGIVVYFSFSRLLWMMFGIDVYVPFENLFCCVFFGGLVDSVKRAMIKEDATASAHKNSPPGQKHKEE